MELRPASPTLVAMATDEHTPLCTLSLVAHRHSERCPGETCPLWDDGCILTRVEAELDGRPELAALLLSLRRRLEALAVDEDGAPSAQPRPRPAGENG